MEHLIISTQKTLEVKQCCVDNATFTEVKMTGAVFNDVNLTGLKITNANISDLEIEGAQLGGAFIHNIGMPPQGHPLFDPNKKQRGLRFDDCNLSNTSFNNCCVDNATFTDIKMTGAVFNDVNLTGLKITGANMSDLEIEGAQLGGAYIHNVGMPPQGQPLYDPNKKQRGLRFDDCNLSNTTFNNCNLQGVSFTDCDVKGVTVNGILLEDLLKGYKQ